MGDEIQKWDPDALEKAVELAYPYYDRQGNRISRDEMIPLAGDMSYKRVCETTLPNGLWVSTVWLAIDHGFRDGGPPVIFETMVFPKHGDWSELDCRRYCTEEDAIRGHHEVVEEWLGMIDQEEDDADEDHHGQAGRG